ncbi:ribonuclease T2 family protein [Phenylobacterium immobile]|uniref:ribonuclease T2 family protein n=1 Tax=Phenylobacterium immobile TaxID=21 RepID=UPI000B223350|nr:hypothetical protein [Phenylobacterium immobile]
MRGLAGILFGASAILSASPALAANCRPPHDLQPAAAYTPPAQEVVRTPTAYHLLAVAWGPEWRRTQGQIPATAQTLDDAGARGFFLHGLWPNGVAPPYPRYCRPVASLPLYTVRSMYCRTPSAELLQHEWQAHGACGWRNPRDYFADAARLYDQLRTPRLKAKEMTAGDIRRAFLRLNPALRADQIIVAHRDGHFSEVRICYSMTYRPRACPAGQGAAEQTRLKITAPIKH